MFDTVYHVKTLIFKQQPKHTGLYVLLALPFFRDSTLVDSLTQALKTAVPPLSHIFTVTYEVSLQLLRFPWVTLNFIRKYLRKRHLDRTHPDCHSKGKGLTLGLLHTTVRTAHLISVTTLNAGTFLPT